jgi:hypothetical protein
VPLLLAVAWKLVECLGLIGEQEGLYSGSVPAGHTSFGADLQWSAGRLHGAPKQSAMGGPPLESRDSKSGRGDWVRTGDPLRPSGALCDFPQLSATSVVQVVHSQ